MSHFFAFHQDLKSLMYCSFFSLRCVLRLFFLGRGENPFSFVENIYKSEVISPRALFNNNSCVYIYTYSRARICTERICMYEFARGY